MEQRQRVMTSFVSRQGRIMHCMSESSVSYGLEGNTTLTEDKKYFAPDCLTEHGNTKERQRVVAGSGLHRGSDWVRECPVTECTW